MKSNKTSWIIGKYPSSWAIAYYNQPNLANDTLVFVMNNAQKILKVSNFSKEYLGKFAYVALTYDGKKIIAYVNGMIKAETNYSESISNLPGVGISIGYFMGSGYFNGSIDDVKIYNRALNAKEINKEFNNYSKISNYLCINGDVYGNATALGYLALVDDCLSDELCVSGESSCFASDDSEDTGSSSCLDGQKAYDENWDSRAAWDKNGMCTINEIYYWNESFNNKILLESKAHATAQSKGHVNYYCYSYNISDYLLMRIENLTSAISTPRFFIPKDCIKDRYVLGLKEELVYDSGRQRIAPIFYYETKVLTAPS
jgi:hypothetical protein